jgi:hypothetical protein
VFRSQRWRNDAEKLAQRYDIALTEAIRPRVASLQRRQYVIGTVLFDALMVFWVIGVTRTLDAVTPREHAFAFVLTAMTFPQALLVCGFAVAWPAWNAPRGQRVTHAAPRSVWQAFTRAEWVALGLGVVVAVVSAGWGFLLVGAGGWWFAWLVAMVGYGGVWRLAAQAIMQRPSRASDPAELGWDDVLRYHETDAEPAEGPGQALLDRDAEALKLVLAGRDLE